jgi:microcystin-dependent protein
MGLSVGLGNVTQVPAGIVSAFAGVTAPSGWLMCYGQAVSRTEYSALFTALSTTYGSGDGSTTFNIPDMRGRAIAGVDNMGGTAASRLTSTVLSASNTLGATGGTQTHTMTSAEMPSHTHTQNAHGHELFSTAGLNLGSSEGGTPDYVRSIFNRVAADSNSTKWTADQRTATNQSTGGGGAHLNTQPTIVLNYIIKATQ